MFCPSLLLFYVWRSICMVAILRHWKSLFRTTQWAKASVLLAHSLLPRASKNTTKNIRNFKIWMWRNGLGPTPSCPSPSPVGCTPVAPLRRYLAWKNAVSNLSFSVRALSFWMFFSISVECTSQRLVTWIAWWRWYAMDLCDEERTLVMRRSNMGPRSKTHHSTLLIAHRETLDFLPRTHQSLGSQREGIIDPLQSCSFITSVALEIQLLKPEIFRIHLYTPTPTQMEFRYMVFSIELRVSFHSRNWISYGGWKWPQSW